MTDNHKAGKAESGADPEFDHAQLDSSPLPTSYPLYCNYITTDLDDVSISCLGLSAPADVKLWDCC